MVVNMRFVKIKIYEMLNISVHTTCKTFNKSITAIVKKVCQVSIGDDV